MAMISKKDQILQSLYRDYENNYLAKNKTTRINLSVVHMGTLLEHQEFKNRIEEHQEFRIYALKVFIKWIRKLTFGQKQSFLGNLKAIKAVAEGDEPIASFVRDIFWEFDQTN